MDPPIYAATNAISKTQQCRNWKGKKLCGGQWEEILKERVAEKGLLTLSWCLSENVTLYLCSLANSGIFLSPFPLPLVSSDHP